MSNIGVFRPTEGGSIGTTCFFRHVELDETVLHLLADTKADILIHADSMGCSSTSLRLLSQCHNAQHKIVSGDLHNNPGNVLDIREGSDYPYDVVYAMNLFCYFSDVGIQTIINTVASYNTRYLVASHITKHHVGSLYKPVYLNQARIYENMRHKDKTLTPEDVFIWERTDA